MVDRPEMLTGTTLRGWRKTHGLSQANLARATGLSQAVISAFELGKRQLREEEVAAVERVRAQVDRGLVPDGVRLRNWRAKRSNGSTEATTTRRSRRDGSVADQAHVASLNGARGLSLQADVRSDGRPVVLSFFAGCGGLSFGFQQAGFRVGGYLEIDRDARESFASNFPNALCLGADITKVTDQDLRLWSEGFGEVDVMCGGPPCQGFSLAGKRDADDPRNRLFLQYLRVARHIRPKAILIENVRLLTSMKNPVGGLVADEIVEQLESIGYSAQWMPLNAADYGVPQWRERVFFLAFRSDLTPSDCWFPTATHAAPTQAIQADLFYAQPSWRTFKDATGDLKPLEAGEADPGDELHWAVAHPAEVVKMLRDVPEGHSAHENADPALRPTSGYNTTYKRLRWDEPSSTIGTTFGMISACRTVHPTNTRSLTIREAMRCQTFPDSFRLAGKTTSLRRQIGNATPPTLAQAIAAHVKRLLEDQVLSPRREPCRSSELGG